MIILQRTQDSIHAYTKSLPKRKSVEPKMNRTPSLNKSYTRTDSGLLSDIFGAS